MTERSDYSGEFDPAFSHADLSKETLLRLREACADLMRAVDGLWYLEAKAKWGNDEAMALDIGVWEKAMMFELAAISGALNIRGDDVDAVLKYLQCNPWFALCDYEIERFNEQYAIVTERTCPTLFALEREGQGREELQCRRICPRIQAIRARFFNPSIRFTQIKAPPRRSEKDICCRWEIALEE